MTNGITAPSEQLLPPWGTPPNEGGNEWWPEWTGGFKWPWETPAGQGFQAPWTTTKPAAPAEPMEMGPNYGPYSDPGQIPPELLELFDYEAIETTSPEGGSAVFYYLVPKATEGMSEAERRRIELAEAEFMAKYGQPGGETGYPLPSGQARTTWDDSGMEWFWNEYSRRYEQSGRYNQAYDMRLQQAEGAAATPEGMSAYEEDYLRYLREKLASEQGLAQQGYGLEQQQYAAQLAAQPKSWLEYAAYTGQPPVVQPFMLPLMPQQYPELAGLQAGQPIPGWPEQFTGTNVGTYGFQGGATPPVGGGTQPTTGYGGATPTGVQPAASAGWRPQTVDDYIARGLSPSEAEQAAEYDRLHAVWRGATPGPEKAEAFLTKGQYAAEDPETIARYQQAISNVQSGQPLLGGLNVQGKFDLVEQLIRQGVDRTLAERQVFGGSRSFAPYTPVSDISGVAPTTPTAPSYVPSTMPIEEREPARKPTPSYKPASIPMEETMGNVKAYIPGMSWHEVDPQGIGPEVEKSNWLGRMRQLGTQQATTEEPSTRLEWHREDAPPTPPSERYSLPPLRGAPGPQSTFDWHREDAPPTPPSERYSLPPLRGAPGPQSTFDWHREDAPPEPSWMRGYALPPAGLGAPTETQQATPSQGYNPAQYAAGSWAGFNPNLPLGQMPALTRPSRQYQARMGPTALDQYYAYVQGRTGITPQEMQFRLGSMAPPGGGYSGLRWMR